MIKHRELRKQLDSILLLLSKTNTAADLDLELRAHWARYLCVLVAGFMENAHAALYSDFARSASSPPVAGFVALKLRKVTNPKAARFLETAGQFKSAWRSTLEAFLLDKGRKEALDSVMTNRHLIVHGKSSNVTIVQVRNYLSLCVEIVEFVEGQCTG